MYTSATARSSPFEDVSERRQRLRACGDAVRREDRQPSWRVGTMTTGIQALASVPSSSWKAARSRSGGARRRSAAARRRARAAPRRSIRHSRLRTPSSSTSTAGSPVGAGERALVEQEDRLDVRPGGAQEPQAPFLRPGVRALVREDDTRLVGLEPERRDQAVAPPGDAVGAGVVLREPPERARVSARVRRRPRHSAAPARRPPRRPGASRGRRCTGFSSGSVARLGRDHVVRRRDEPSSGPARRSS